MLAPGHHFKQRRFAIPHHHATQPRVEEGQIVEGVSRHDHVSFAALEPVKNAHQSGPLVHPRGQHVEVHISRSHEVHIQVSQRLARPLGECALQHVQVWKFS